MNRPSVGPGPYSAWSRRRLGRRLGLAGLVVLTALLVVPSVGGLASGAFASPVAPAAAPHAAAHAATAAPSVPARPAAPAVPVPGSNPALNLPAAPNPARADAWGTAAARRAALPVAAPPTDPTPPQQNYAVGWFTGTVANSTDPSETVTNVAVQAYALQTENSCPTDLCQPVQSGTDGTFNVTCPSGLDYLTFQKPWYAENLTYATCLTGQTVSVGTVLIVLDGTVTGTLLADVTGTPPVVAAPVQGTSRDAAVLALPQVATNLTGGFSVPVPPGVASLVDFTPPGGNPNYETNFSYVDVASGATVNIGTVYLEPFSTVQTEIMDAVTGQPITGTFAAMTVCSETTNVCGAQGPTTSGPWLVATGPSGYDYLQVEVLGYVDNTTAIGYVPPELPHSAYCVPNDCKVYLSPLGYVQGLSAISLGNRSSQPFDNALGLYYVSVTGLNGFYSGLPLFNPATGTYNMTQTQTLTGSPTYGCYSGNQPFQFYAFPLRNQVTITPDTTGQCDPFGTAPEWPIPGDLPVWGNWTTANVTPDEVTNVGYLNLTPGAYIEGNVYVQGTTSAPSGGFSVVVKSLYSRSIASEAYTTNYSPDPCPEKGATVFCAPAPPGPDYLTVTANGYPQNDSWVSVPWSICCVKDAQLPPPGPLTLAYSTSPSIDSINLTAPGSIAGHVLMAGGNETVPNAGIEACPAGSNEPANCADGSANVTGYFHLKNVPLGWDYVTAVGSSTDKNGEWVDVNGSMAVPSIPLLPLARLVGQVTASDGTPIIDASISQCPVDASSLAGVCSSLLGTGVTQSDGAYFGVVQGGWLPWATYEVQAAAPGYVTDWTFVNATANTTNPVPTIVLQAVGANSTVVGGARAHPSPSPSSTWVTGRLVDNVTGRGVLATGLSACPVANPGQCFTFANGVNSGGYFNQSLPLGIYNLTASIAGYYPLLFPFDADELPSVDLGSVPVEPLNWVQGNVTLSPWATVLVNWTSGNGHLHHTQILLVPPASVTVCTNTGGCTAADMSGTAGNFEVQALAGNYQDLEASPTFAGGPNTAPGGVRPAIVPVNITTGQLWIPTNESPALQVFAAVSGTVWVAASYDNATGAFTDPARWSSISVLTQGPNNNGQAIATVNGGGAYTVYLPGGNRGGSTNVTASDTGMFYPNETNVPAELGPGQNFTYTVAPLALTQFGFAVGTFVDSVTGAGVPSVGVTATYNNKTSHLFGSGNGASNTGGFVNLSAPSGSPVQFSAGGANDYNGTMFNETVAPGQAVNLTGPNAKVNGTIPIDHWGWVASEYLDYGAPPIYPGTVLDSSNHEPLPLTTVAVASTDPVYGSGANVLPSNDLGQFLTDAPIGAKDAVTATHPGYEANTSLVLNITANSYHALPTINMSGYGVVAGQVVSVPGDVPVPGAQVSTCPGSSPVSRFCVYTVTNATGWYWTTAVPGHDSISVTATGFASNYTEPVVVASDSWQEVPRYILTQYGTIYGVVRGLPTGLAVGGALVSACSPIGGVPTGPCLFSIQTQANGSFALSVVPGSFVLAISMADFNTTYLPISVAEGAGVNVGNRFLQEYGVLAGNVVNGATGAPILNATVDGCPLYAYLTCVPTTATDLHGAFRLAAPPGAVALTVTASGFDAAYLTVNAVSGTSVVVPTIALAPLSIEQTYRVSGHVTTSTGAALPGAVVSFQSGTAIASSTESGTAGAFSTDVPTGTYSVVVSDPGYASATETVVVTTSVEGLQFALPVFTWPLTVVVRDGLTGAPVTNAAIWSPTGLLGATGAGGTFSVALPNGSYPLSVLPSGAGGTPYVPVDLVASVIGSPGTRVVDLYPPSAAASGTVTSSRSGSGIGGATVTLVGTAVDGAPVADSITTNGTGAFDLPAVYEGTYTLTVSASGYATWTENVTIGGSASTLTPSLTPLAPASSPAPLGAWVAGLGGVALLGAAVVAVLLLGRRGGRTR